MAGAAATDSDGIDTPVLTEFEIELLTMIAHGLPIDEIAVRQKTSTKTAIICIQMLTRKMGANNTAHAVAIGFKWGVLTPDSFAG